MVNFEHLSIHRPSWGVFWQRCHITPLSLLLFSCCCSSSSRLSPPCVCHWSSHESVTDRIKGVREAPHAGKHLERHTFPHGIEPVRRWVGVSAPSSCPTLLKSWIYSGWWFGSEFFVSVQWKYSCRRTVWLGKEMKHRLFNVISPLKLRHVCLFLLPTLDHWVVLLPQAKWRPPPPCLKPLVAAWCW